MTTARARQVIDIGGSDARLVARISEPLRLALAGRRSWYGVRIEPVGRNGDVVLQIDGMDGHLALLLGASEIEPGRLANRVRTSVACAEL